MTYALSRTPVAAQPCVHVVDPSARLARVQGDALVTHSDPLCDKPVRAAAVHHSLHTVVRLDHISSGIADDMSTRALLSELLRHPDGSLDKELPRRLVQCSVPVAQALREVCSTHMLSIRYSHHQTALAAQA